jgi:hypothetical protein
LENPQQVLITTSITTPDLRSVSQALDDFVKIQKKYISIKYEVRTTMLVTIDLELCT